MNAPTVFRSAALAVVLVLGGCASAEPEPPERDAEIELLASWMGGRFSSIAQAIASPEEYLDIAVIMARVWPERSDGVWLYVEQAAAATPNEPYRRRVYRLERDAAGRIVARIYEFPEAALERVRGGQWASMVPEELSYRAGCDVVFERLGPRTFVGGTEGEGCASRLGEAVYATSSVVVTPVGLRSWDRGFDKAGRQVWGPASGPYVFDKLPD